MQPCRAPDPAFGTSTEQINNLDKPNHAAGNPFCFQTHRHQDFSYERCCFQNDPRCWHSLGYLSYDVCCYSAGAHLGIDPFHGKAHWIKNSDLLEYLIASHNDQPFDFYNWHHYNRDVNSTMTVDDHLWARQLANYLMTKTYLIMMFLF